VGLKDAQFAYLSTGQEVRPNMLQDLEDDAEVYVSEKEGFFRSSTHDAVSIAQLLSAAHRRQTWKL
jgi:hypothetical protein